MVSKVFLIRHRSSRKQRSISQRKRRGIALVVVLVALTIVVGVLLPLIPPALRARRQVELEGVALQNQFLKSAVTQRLALTAPSEIASDEELSKLSGQVRFGPNDSLQGEWLVRRKEPTENGTRELEVTVRIEFKESSESGVSPWIIPKSEAVFPFPFENKNESQQ
ncbi:MAG: hypothetical protein MUC43_08400 [Pirellula sp.]|jgi:type II secretory pathway component PulK|nr:hypothetical protein [Pirellula sp.]